MNTKHTKWKTSAGKMGCSFSQRSWWHQSTNRLTHLTSVHISAARADALDRWLLSPKHLRHLSGMLGPSAVQHRSKFTVVSCTQLFYQRVGLKTSNDDINFEEYSDNAAYNYTMSKNVTLCKLDQYSRYSLLAVLALSIQCYFTV